MTTPAPRPHWLLLLVLCCLCLTRQAGAQTTYWTHQYGTRSTLLGGAVIGSVTDLGSTFYNPGMFALTGEASFVLNARIQQNVRITVEDGAGEGRDLKTTKYGGVPSLAAGTFGLGWFEGHKFAYSMMSRHFGDTGLGIRGARAGDVLPGVPGDELFAGDFSYGTKLEDWWAGVTWAYAIGPTVGFGITQYLAIFDQSVRRRLLLEALMQDGRVAAAIQLRELDAKTYRTLTKVGLALNLPRFSAGLTLTTPSIFIMGSGTVLYNSVLSGGDLTGDGASDDYAVSNAQSDVAAYTRSPLSVGAGAAYWFGQLVRLHVSAEWYDKVGSYDVLDTEPFTAQSTGETLEHTTQFEAKSVLNYGFGAEVNVSERFSGYGSFVTDFSASPEAESGLSEAANIDFYHLAGGVVFSVMRSDFTLGLAYSFGSSEISQLVDFDPDAPDPGSPVEAEETATVNVSRMKFIFGFEIDF